MQLLKTSPWSCWDIKPNIFGPWYKPELQDLQCCKSRLVKERNMVVLPAALALAVIFALVSHEDSCISKNLPVMHGTSHYIGPVLGFFFTLFFPYHTHPKHLATSSLSACPRPTTFCNPKGLSFWPPFSAWDGYSALYKHKLLTSPLKQVLCLFLPIKCPLCTGQASSDGF